MLSSCTFEDMREVDTTMRRGPTMSPTRMRSMVTQASAYPGLPPAQLTLFAFAPFIRDASSGGGRL